MTFTTKTAILTAILLWASAYVGIRAGLQFYSPEGLALLRYLIASLVMGLVYFNLQERSQIRLQDKIKLMLVGVIGIGVYNITLNRGELEVSSGLASFITNVSPIVTTMMAVMFLGEQLNVQRILGLVVSVLGIMMIAYGEVGSFQLSDSMMYMLAAMIASSCYSLMQKPFLKLCNATEATAYVIWGGTLFLMMYFSSMLHDVTHAPLSATLIVVYLGIFPAAIAYLAWSYVLQRLTVSQTVSYMFVIPFGTTLMGWALLHEVPAMLSALGALIAIAGVWLVNQSYQETFAPEFEPEAEAKAA